MKVITLIIAKINNLGEELWSNPIFEFTDIWGNSTIIPLNNGGFVVSFMSIMMRVLDIPSYFDMVGFLGNVNSIYYFQSERKYMGNSTIIPLNNGGFVVSFYEYNDEGNWIYPPILIWLDLGKC